MLLGLIWIPLLPFPLLLLGLILVPLLLKLPLSPLWLLWLTPLLLRLLLLPLLWRWELSLTPLLLSWRLLRPRVVLSGLVQSSNFSCASRCTSSAVITDMSPHVECYQHHQNDKDHHIQAMENGSERIQVIAQEIASICEQKTPRKCSEKGIDTKFHKGHFCNARRERKVVSVFISCVNKK